VIFGLSFGSPYFTLPKFKYVRPKSIEEALEYLKDNGEDARVMAGGVGLLNFMKERLVEPKLVIDLKGIPELHKIEYNGRLIIGATTTLNEILSFPKLRDEYNALYEAISVLSDHNLRNRSTLAGDLCEALPWVDSPPPLIAYDAMVNIIGSKGSRSVKVKDFIKGMAQVDLAPDEIVTSIELPEAAEKRGRFYKFAKGSEFSIASLAIVFDASINELRLVFGGVSDIPYYPEELSEMFSKAYSAGDYISNSISYIRKNFTPLDDSLASSEYR
jgi:Aerobic-type carbon monoxide dehydrogenase, middle subunit CoxM/CutM homologs